MKAYPRILKYSLPYTGQMLLSVGCHLLYAFFSLFTFGLIVPFASILFGLTEAVTVRPELHLSADSLMDMLSYGITWLQQHYSLGMGCENSSTSSCPPGLSTRRISFNPASRSEKLRTPKAQVTASKRPSA